MINRLSLSLALILFAPIAACDADAHGKMKTAIGGAWSQEFASGDKHGMTLEFGDGTDKLFVHTAPDKNGDHGHLDGSYEFSADTGMVTVQCPLAGENGGKTWTGKLDGEQLMLTSGEASLKFAKGAKKDH